MTALAEDNHHMSGDRERPGNEARVVLVQWNASIMQTETRAPIRRILYRYL